MAMTQEEAAASAQKDETKMTTGARSLSQFSSAIIKLTALFLNDSESKNLSETAQFFHIACQKDMKTRKKVRNALLPHIFVFTIDEDKLNPIHQFFNLPDNDASMVLTKTRFREGYDSKKFNEFICFREYRGISAIQAAARSGDIFLLTELLDRLLKSDDNNRYRKQALQQLEEVHERISNQDILLDAVTAIKEIEFGENDIVKVAGKSRLEEIQQSTEFQKQMQEFIKEMEELSRQTTDKKTKIKKRATNAPSHNSPGLKSEIERKVITENTAIKYADDAEVLEPVLKLLKAYIYYYLQYPRLASQNKSDKIDRLWEYVGECHRRLPHYFKQEFFNDKPFSINPLPTFETSPLRAFCRYWNNVLLNLDRLGIGSTFGLYKGSLLHPYWCVRLGWVRALWLDMAVAAHLYKLRITGLGNIIERLKHPEPQILSLELPSLNLD